MTDILRSVRFFMLIMTSYGNKGTAYGCIKKDIKRTVEYLDSIQERLSRIIIECKYYADLIKVFDRSDALSYWDHPYMGQ